MTNEEAQEYYNETMPMPKTMTDTPILIPDWALVKARELRATLYLHPMASLIVTDRDIARAILAADKAATLRERERRAKRVEDGDVWFASDYNVRHIAAAIRKEPT